MTKALSQATKHARRVHRAMMAIKKHIKKVKFALNKNKIINTNPRN